MNTRESRIEKGEESSRKEEISPSIVFFWWFRDVSVPLQILPLPLLTLKTDFKNAAK